MNLPKLGDILVLREDISIHILWRSAKCIVTGIKVKVTGNELPLIEVEGISESVKGYRHHFLLDKFKTKLESALDVLLNEPTKIE